MIYYNRDILWCLWKQSVYICMFVYIPWNELVCFFGRQESESLAERVYQLCFIQIRVLFRMQNTKLITH